MQEKEEREIHLPNRYIHPDLTSHRHNAHARATRNETISRSALQAPIPVFSQGFELFQGLSQLALDVGGCELNREIVSFRVVCAYAWLVCVVRSG